MVALVKSDNHIAHPQAKSNEWYTPARYIEAAREVMGSIDLDPASCELANQTVKATRYYSKEDDGLTKPWYGNVWLNPPYGSTNGKSNIAAFAYRLISEFRNGHVVQAIILTTSKTSSTWFHDLWNYPICFTYRNINFDCLIPIKSRFNGKACHIHGSCLAYLGSNEQKFIEVFSQFGTIAKRVSPPKSAPSTLWEVTT